MFAVPTSCSPRSELPGLGASDAGSIACVDNDHDGFGNGCAAGADCDDSDPSSGNECYACIQPRPGCPCTSQGQRASCGQVQSTVGKQVTCGYGETVCDGGVYGECIINNSVTLLPGGDPKQNTKVLGPPTLCAANPCDPYCMTWPDEPSGLGISDGGVVVADGGLTIPSTGGAPPASSCSGGTSGSCAHHICQTGTQLSPGCDAIAPSCVSAVCSAMPSCCTAEWTGLCVNAIEANCPGSSCAIDTSGQCVFCFADSTDHDGDGYAFTEGDCKDCNPLVNPGAYDFPGNGVDDDCSGTVDDEPTGCDVGLPFSTSATNNYAKAIDICRFSTASASGSAKTWGVLSDSLVQANGSSACSNTLQRAITSQFGNGNFPKAGQRMAVFSSGTARDSNDPGYVNPSGQVASYNAGTFATPPAGFPKNAAGCPNGSAARDSCGYKLQIRAPTNAQSFAFDFNFFSTEYSEWICTAYNDSFIALYYGALNPFADKNISFDAANNPVSVNVGFFSIPTSPTQTSHPLLDGTGFSGYCNNYGYSPSGMCGGATNWLTTTAPVSPGEVITLHFSIWDTGDNIWDSTVLIDNFRWSSQTATIQTQPTIPPPPPPTFSAGDFIRDYDANEACPPGTKPVWGSWSWTSSTPSDSSIAFYVKTSPTLAGLDTAPEDALRFTNPPGPGALAGTAAVARTSPIDTRNGSAVVAQTFATMSRPQGNRFVRVRSALTPSTDLLSAPVLHAWNLEASCQPDE
ncbi:MAG: choice-of-anchor L domain-containing protein [Polyangiaceae bacterium]